MKKVSLSALIILLAAGLSVANKYKEAMSEAIKKMYSANDLKGYLDASATFERIGTAESGEWLPWYYACLGNIWASHQVQDGQQIDKYLDNAQLFLDRAEKLSADNDEIITLQGYIYMMKVVVDPPTRGQEYSGMAMNAFGRAAAINTKNPRALLLLGRMQMGTDQFFGNDISQSCEKIRKASEMFDDQHPVSALHPAWGKEMAEMFLNECKSN
jgi:hypothetical protein